MLAPLHLGLRVQMHHHFASRFLIDYLYHHGFCCPYKVVHLFERNSACFQGTDMPNMTNEFVQYAAESDNVDHNIQILDGHGTFHGMGMIAAITPATRISRPIRRPKVTANEPVGSDPREIVLHLGGLHTEMSFLGCMGHLMASSG